jgi:hypothetical protein
MCFRSLTTKLWKGVKMSAAQKNTITPEEYDQAWGQFEQVLVHLDDTESVNWPLLRIAMEDFGRLLKCNLSPSQEEDVLGMLWLASNFNAPLS